MHLIDEFMERYEREYDYYCQVSKRAEELCQVWLEKNAIRGIVTSRGKNPKNLREKIISRAQRKGYKNLEDIYTDIVDLAGIRVALYFPNNIMDVDSIFKRHLYINKIIEFPNQNNDKAKRIAPGFHRKNKGYVATHYRAYLKPDTLKANERRFSQAHIEIQVASVLMHAWSEVEHDLAYKARAGELSHEEFSILDDINGIVLQGEAALLSLWDAGDERLIRTKNHIHNKYELSAILHQLVDRLPPGDSRELNVDEVELMMEYLETTGTNSTEHLEDAFKCLNQTNAKTNICARIIKSIETHSELHKETQL